MLEVVRLTKKFGAHKAVDGVSFSVQPGDAFGLLGPNGAGKSTTISMISGLLVPDDGEVLLDGRSLRKNPRYLKQRIGLVPQSIALYEHLTAEENLKFWGTIYGLYGARLADNVNWCLKVAGLESHRKEQVKKFSGGMQRRLNIAVGMIHRPEILIMDEPTVGIDPQSRNHILETVRELNQDGMAIIYTSHYMEEVQFLCKRLAIIDHGQMIAYGHLDDIRQLAGTLSTIRMVVKGDLSQAVVALKNDLAFQTVQNDNEELLLQTQDAASGVAKAVGILRGFQLQPASIEIQEPNLEAAFLHLTGRQLRDGREGVSA
ncbi:ABC transporter ATP-binding protein [Alicyclobacillus herbarius]|uniref:ABC transporter ATP-binding protein n=1 Tax=Alicyclobacillus herbarius TaxID=122960 RepID=UPI00041BBC04|nr:ABC transporter ATP-binding protein [Alicyclobacillus herbarius]